jgi:hypothetical protein
MKAYLIIILLHNIISQIFNFDNHELKISNYSMQLEFEERKTIQTNKAVYNFTNYTNSYINITLPLTSTSSVSYSRDSSQIQDLQLCPSCFVYNKASSSLPECSTEGLFVTPFEEKEVKVTLGLRNVQLGEYNLQLINGSLIILQLSNWEVINRYKVSDYVPIQADEVVINFQVLKVYGKLNVIYYRVLTISGYNLYVWDIDVNGSTFKITPLQKLSISDIYTGEYQKNNIKINLNNTIDFYQLNHQGITLTKLVLKENVSGIGFLELTSSGDSILKMMTYSEVQYGNDYIGLNITDSFTYAKEQDGDFPMSIYHYLLIKDYGLVVIQNTKVISVFQHPYIERVESISDIKPGETFYISLYIAHYTISEYFIELAVNPSDPAVLKINKIFTHWKSFRGFASDHQSKVTYFYNTTSVLQIHREIPYDIPIIEFKHHYDGTEIVAFNVLSSLEGVGYISMHFVDKVVLLKPRKVDLTSKLRCNFTETGTYTIKVSNYTSLANSVVEYADEYNIHIVNVEARWFIWILVVFGGLAFTFFCFVMYRRYLRKKNTINLIIEEKI